MQDQDQLTPEERDLEQALRSLRPAAARIDPVAAAHAAGRRSPRGRLWTWQAAAAVAALAAGGAWLASGSRPLAPEFVERHAPRTATTVTAVAQSAVEPPTLLAYRRAMWRPSGELDALLDRQATAGAGRKIQITPVGMFKSWDANFYSSMGEM